MSFGNKLFQIASNVSKTSAMMFSNRHNSDAAGVQLLLHGSDIQFERHFKFLGVIIDKKTESRPTHTFVLNQY